MSQQNPVPPTQPVALAAAISSLAVADTENAPFQREGLRDDFEYRNLGMAAATGGRIGAIQTRALCPFEKPTGWHWHDLTLHMVYVLKGSLTFRFAEVDEPVTVSAGGCINQPPGVPHTVIGRTDDLQVIEITMPAKHGTFDTQEPA